MTALRLAAPAALLDTGWSADVLIGIDADGVITEVTAGVKDERAEPAGGPVVAAMSNVHSHAFQRALAGHTGRAAAEGHDSFWTWRVAMYASLDCIDADGFEAIAAQAYVEMAKAGYANVVEFHYVHNDAAGSAYADPAELAWRIVAAARTSGLGLTLLPVFYAHAGFGGTPPAPGQRRFVQSLTRYAELVAVLRAAGPRHGYVSGVAPHSLRAVTPDEFRTVVGLADRSAPVHIHAAEQSREVDDSVAFSGLRPVEWLLANAHVDSHWCLVHATHMTERETRALAQTGAVAGLAPTTEADLGDGFFPGEAYLGFGGHFGVGSDSNTILDPFVELRQLEWSQRLRLRRRNVLVPARGSSIGNALWSAAAHGGGRACGRATGTLAPGSRADLIVLDPDEPALAHQLADRLLDAAIFGPCRRPVRHLMSGGEWVVRDGHHAREDEVFTKYRATLTRLDFARLGA